MKLTRSLKFKPEFSTWATFVALTAAVLFAFLGHPTAQQTNLAPFQTITSVANTASMNAVPSNPTRRGLIICNSNATAANILTVTFGAATPVSGSGLVIPGGNVQASCFVFPVTGTGMGAQLNYIMSVAGPTNVTTLEF